MQERIEKYSKNEIRFNLMAVIKNKKDLAEEQLAQYSEMKSALEAKLRGEGMDVEGEEMRSESELRGQLNEVESKIQQLEVMLANEEEKFKNWREENVRRKHNYIPFMFYFLKGRCI